MITVTAVRLAAPSPPEMRGMVVARERTRAYHMVGGSGVVGRCGRDGLSRAPCRRPRRGGVRPVAHPMRAAYPRRPAEAPLRTAAASPAAGRARSTAPAA
ncbi:hypothetical protein TBS_30400 [Thermobispora bispora]